MERQSIAAPLFVAIGLGLSMIVGGVLVLKQAYPEAS